MKSLWNPAARRGFNDCYGALARAYLDGVSWEPVPDLEARAAHLLAGLFLARVDGKSPVEYITQDSERDKVRRCARPLVASPPARLAKVAQAWEKELAA